MEKRQKNKYDYSAISIKADVAVRFRRYSKQFSKSNSEVLHRMLFFLQWIGLRSFGRSVNNSLESKP
ncbi:MAG TPA: BfmA/BtgA family mobilization protein [Gillisia sp.]|nr:BfmA/BtgA family mobilization protein [Gillisia sp.]